MTRREVRKYNVTPPDATDIALVRALLEHQALAAELQAAVNELVAAVEATAHKDTNA